MISQLPRIPFEAHLWVLVQFSTVRNTGILENGIMNYEMDCITSEYYVEILPLPLSLTLPPAPFPIPESFKYITLIGIIGIDIYYIQCHKQLILTIFEAHIVVYVYFKQLLCITCIDNIVKYFFNKKSLRKNKQSHQCYIQYIYINSYNN